MRIFGIIRIETSKMKNIIFSAPLSKMMEGFLNVLLVKILFDFLFSHLSWFKLFTVSNDSRQILV